MLAVNDNISLSGLKEIEVERPEDASDRWKGIKHYDLVRGILSECKQRNWTVSNRQIAISNDWSTLSGSVQLEIPSIKLGKGFSPALGFLTDNCRTKALRFFIGGIVESSGIGFVTNRVILRKRHTINLDLDLEIKDAFEEFAALYKTIKKTRNNLQERPLKPSEYNRLLIQAGRMKLMPWSRLGRVDAEFMDPEYSVYGRMTSWTLLCAFSTHVQYNPPLKQLEQLNRFREILPTAEKVAVAA